ncbi:hypothetical protein D3C75_698710 [compost metagenome]
MLLGDFINADPVIHGQLVLRNLGSLHTEDRAQQPLTEFLNRHFCIAEQILDIGNPAAHGLCALGFKLLGVHVQGSLYIIEIKIEHQGAMAEHPSAGGELGVAGDFALADLQVVASAQLCVDSHGLQIVDDRLGEFEEVVERFTVIPGDEAEIQVAEVMIHCSASGEPAHDLDVVFFYIFLINLFDCILVLADDDGRAVDIKEQIAVVHREVFERELLNGQVDRSVCNAGVINKEHGIFLRLYMVNYCIYSKLKARISQNRKYISAGKAKLSGC